MKPKIFSSGLSTAADGLAGVQELAQKIRKDFKGASCDIAILFISEGYQQTPSPDLARAFYEAVRPRFFIGCNSSGVIGDGSEIEMEPGLSVMAMHLPGIRVTPFVIAPHELAILDTGAELVEILGLDPAARPKFISLGEPMSCDITKFLTLLNQGYPDAPVIGGLASGVVVGTDNWLILGKEIYPEGVVGLALEGAIEFENVVSQGCRPIGEPLIITKSEQNVVYELAGQPVLEVLGKVYEALSPDDQQLAKHSLFVGMVMDEKRHKLKRGDFLIRNIMGVDYDKNALVVGELLAPGQTFQFQLRDAKAAEEDLECLLQNLPAYNASQATGGILVSCCGRGKGLFKEADHDVRMIRKLHGPVPLTGFFANGEFGLINRKNYVHGYTSSLTLLR